ncbi:hypothetical protein [Flavobacterium gawalongense]|uniref:Uncharacterized protein n=1 Tax=Flavobacterium gawalongense TaxID=2594432 RepID=A0A553BW43_9FLAO|nr:hypothetical protein [Flavobacterium gawalongense]TRX02052.1 hypothetical protein FNW33_07750 [Flavobacterium gawalongense]TRX06580.1 hypothetical protein FNW12_08285 [Flavobacterium gawalongense]TRX12491.1 hypothetical protein FNW11_02835 [Flavobacterium gawalongense]TRX12688.1 hypothetical protein FNW10_03820 [Flavobacterium gawalongense]TRX30523.1 hypothetical protein FNW38_03925 [Flavobacterium gawalongense]
MENIAVTVADNLIGKDLLQEIIAAVINEIDYSDELKLKIINALSLVREDAGQINLGIDFYRDVF